MPTVSEQPVHLSPLTESFLHNLQYTLGFLGRVAFDEGIFHRAVRNLHASLTALLDSQKLVRVHVCGRRVLIDDALLPDSYVLKRIFVRCKCPSIRFERGIEMAEVLNFLREIESLLKQELTPAVLEILPKPESHYRWLASNTAV